MKPSNRPKKGDVIRVEPIPGKGAVERIKELLAYNPRNKAMFIFGVNTNLRACDLLRLSIGDVRGLSVGDPIILREKKTDKVRSIPLNQMVHEAVQAWLKQHPDPVDTAPLFRSTKTGKAITVPTLNNLVKDWCQAVGLKGNFGSHTLRKTFGYIHRTEFGTDLPTLMAMYNHSTQRQTLDYLCIQPEEILSAYLREI